MNKTVTGEENLYFEIESAREETDTRIYDDVLSECATTATKQTSLEKHSSQEAEKKRNASAEHHNACQCDTVSLRRMLFLMSIVAAVALLTAVASLILALTAMKLQNDSTAKVQESGSTSTMKSEDDDRIEKVSENITKLDKKMEERIQQLEKRIPDERLVNNVSKMTGPIGPPGFNGSQGAAGPRGANGPPGPKGVGNFSTCQYTIVKDSHAPGVHALASKTEPTGKIILGAACSTNYAAEYNLKSVQRPGDNGKWTYVCDCRGTSTRFTTRGTKYCYLHYWECPLTT